MPLAAVNGDSTPGGGSPPVSGPVAPRAGAPPAGSGAMCPPLVGTEKRGTAADAARGNPSGDAVRPYTSKDAARRGEQGSAGDAAPDAPSGPESAPESGKPKCVQADEGVPSPELLAHASDRQPARCGRDGSQV